MCCCMVLIGVCWCCCRISLWSEVGSGGFGYVFCMFWNNNKDGYVMFVLFWSFFVECIVVSCMEVFWCFVNQCYVFGLVDYLVLYVWSVQWCEVFWQVIVDFFEVCFQ